jgi:hypothetical protein
MQITNLKLPLPRVLYVGMLHGRRMARGETLGGDLDGSTISCALLLPAAQLLFGSFVGMAVLARGADRSAMQ